MTKGAVWPHTIPDLQGNIPAFIHVFDVRPRDVNVPDMPGSEVGPFHVMDWACPDFEHLHHLNSVAASLSRERSQAPGVAASPPDPWTAAPAPSTTGPCGWTLVFLTDSFALRDMTVADIHRSRWQVGPSFRWIRHYLRIKSFFGTPENAVRSRTRTAVSST